MAWTNEVAKPDAAGRAALPDQREYDVVVAAGEQVTSGLLAIDGIVHTETLPAFRAYSRHDLDAMFELGAE